MNRPDEFPAAVSATAEWLELPPGAVFMRSVDFLQFWLVWKGLP